MPWKDVNRTRAAARASAKRRHQTAKALGLCWRCFPKKRTPARTICDDCRFELKLKRCGVAA